MTQKSKSYPTSPRWLKVFLDIWENRSRTILVVASIAVGVFAVGMIVAAYDIIATDMEISYSGANPANIEIRTDPFDADFVETVARMPEVQEAEGRRRAQMRISQDQGETWRGLTVIALDDFDETLIFTRKLIAGHSAPADREILMENRILEDLDLAEGDLLTIQLANGTLREVAVVGFVQDQGIAGGPDAEAVAYITMDTLIWLGESRSFNQLLVTVAEKNDDLAHIDEVAVLVEDRVERNGGRILVSSTGTSQDHPAADTVLAILGVMGVMGGMMLLLGGSLIANTLTALLNQQMRQIGVMKLVGARNFQIIGMYLVLIITLSLISLLVAVPLAAFGGYAMASFFGDLLSITIGEFRFVPTAVGIQIAIAVVIPILAGVMPIINGARATVEEAISENDGSDSGREGWFEKLGESLEWISRPLLISLRNTFRNMRRLMLTLFTLTIAGGIFIGVFNVQASLENFIDNVTRLFIADVSIALDRPYRTAELSAMIETLPGVVDTEGWLRASGEIALSNDTDIELIIEAPPAGTALVDPELKEGRFLQAGDQNSIVVAETIWDDLPDVRAGDTVQLAINGNREEAWTIVGIYQFPGPGAEFILAYAPYETVSKQLNQVGLTTDFKVVTSRHTLADQQAFSDEFDQFLQDQGIRVVDIEPGRTRAEGAADAISILISFFLSMAILTAIVGSIGLAGTMSMNVMERIREIGILRAIGAVDSAVMSSVLIEGIFVGVLSWLLGIFLSYPISLGLLSLVSNAIANSAMPLFFNPTGYWVWLLVIIVLSALASVLPARNASRLTIREVLAYE